MNEQERNFIDIITYDQAAIEAWWEREVAHQLMRRQKLKQENELAKQRWLDMALPLRKQPLGSP